jgi:hypothetical protein
MIDRTGDVPNVPLAPVRARGGVLAEITGASSTEREALPRTRCP